MVELVKYIVLQFISKPEEFEIVEEKESDNTVKLTLTLAPEDMGKVIGKQGKIAKAIRTIVKAASSKENVRYLVEICDKK